MPPFLSPWSRLDLGEKKVFKWPSKSRWLQQLLSTSRSDLSGGVSKTCAKCHLWNMLVYVHHKKKRLDFCFILYLYSTCHWDFQKDLNCFSKTCESCQVLLKDKSPLPCCPRGFGWKVPAKNFSLRRDFCKIISRYETLFLLCCWALPVQHFMVTADNESVKASLPTINYNSWSRQCFPAFMEKNEWLVCSCEKLFRHQIQHL